MRRLDPEYVERFMREERNFQLLEPYVNNKTPMKGVCLVCGYKDGKPRWNNVKNDGAGACDQCRREKRALDPEYVRQFMRDERNFQLTEPYVNAHTPMKGICLTCGEEGSPTWNNVQTGDGACKPCGNKKKSLDPEYVRNKLIHEKSFYPLEPYVSNKTPLKGVCLTCGEEGSPTWANVNREGAGACSNCSGKRPLDPAFVRREMIKTYKFLPSEPYAGSDIPMRGICLVCKSPGAPTWDSVNSGSGACSGKCRKKGMKYNVPAVAYLVGGYVKDAGPCLKVGIAEAQRDKKRGQENARLGLDTRLATLHFPTGYKALDFETDLKRLINAGPGNLNDLGLSFKGSKETFEINAADQEFLRDLLGRFGITNVPIPSLWTYENFRSRFEAWSSFTLAA